MAPPANLQQLLERAIFPGMTAAESMLVRGYLKAHGAEWDEADVEARIGPGVVLPQTTDAKARADWERRTKARPDLVIKRAPNVVGILEAKEHLTNEGVWQVLHYRDLWRAEHPTDAVIPIVIAGSIAPTAGVLLRRESVHLHLFALDLRALSTDAPEEQGDVDA